MRKLLLLCITLSLIVLGCSRNEPMMSRQDILTVEARNYYEQQVASPKAQRFLNALKLYPVWEKAIIDSFGAIRIPMISELNLTNSFEIKVWKSKDGFAGKYQQFVPRKNGYSNFPFSLDGNRLFKIVVKRRSQMSTLTQSSPAANTKDSRNVETALSEEEDVDISDYNSYGNFLLGTCNHDGSPAVSVSLMPCPDGLSFDPQECNCDFPENINSYAYPHFYLVIYDDGFYEFLPYSDSLDDVVVVTDPTNPTDPTDPGGDNTGPIGGGGGGGGTGGGSTSSTMYGPILKKLCGLYNWAKIGNSYNAVLTPLHASEHNDKQGYTVTATFYDVCVTLPMYGINTNDINGSASKIINDAFNSAVATVHYGLNNGKYNNIFTDQQYKDILLPEIKNEIEKYNPLSKFSPGAQANGVPINAINDNSYCNNY